MVLARSKHRIAIAASANKSRKMRNFEVGDLVMCRDLTMRRYSAIQAKYDGPYIIDSIEPSGHTAIITNITTKKQKKCHFEHLFHCPSGFKNCVLPSGWDKELLGAVRIY